MPQVRRSRREAAVTDRIVNRYITFVRRVPNNARIKTECWEVQNNRSGESLGEISWFTGWRQYVFAPEPFTEFNVTCLREIAEQCERLNEQHRQGRRR